MRPGLGMIRVPEMGILRNGAGKRPWWRPPWPACLAVGAISDLCATKLNALTRAALRDYFDLAIIETNAGLTAEEGVGLLVARYKPKVPGASLVELTRNLTYFEDVAEDDRLPVTVEEMAVYWTARYPSSSPISTPPTPHLAGSVLRGIRTAL